MGKTNILDAVHYLALTKSAFQGQDIQHIRHDTDFFSVMGTFVVNGEQQEVGCSLKREGKKLVKLNKQLYERLSDHVGKFPVVLIGPDDTALIREGSEVRRRFFDGVLAQSDHDYLEKLMKYNHLLKQRNGFLKQAFESNRLDKMLLESFDDQLLPLNAYITEKRAAFIERYRPVFTKIYGEVSEGREHTDITYTSQAQESGFEDRYRAAVRADYQAQRTTMGIHRDDYVFTIDAHPVKRYGSQGQQKSYVIALKLAQFDTMGNVGNQKPLLLLDDIFDKLDDRRIRCLLDMVADARFGQLFITDARKERTNHFLSILKEQQKDVEIRIFEVADGAVKEATG